MLITTSFIYCSYATHQLNIYSCWVSCFCCSKLLAYHCRNSRMSAKHRTLKTPFGKSPSTRDYCQLSVNRDKVRNVCDFPQPWLQCNKSLNLINSTKMWMRWLLFFVHVCARSCVRTWVSIENITKWKMNGKKVKKKKIKRNGIVLIVTCSSDKTNTFATFLPYNWIFLWFILFVFGFC